MRVRRRGESAYTLPVFSIVTLTGFVSVFVRTPVFLSVEIILHAARSETSSNSWKLSVMSEANGSA